MALIDPGQMAAPFEMKDQEGRVHTLEAYRGRPVVLYFYPKDDTETCTVQACRFRDGLPAFGGAGAAVLGVSPDHERSHAKFAGKFGLGFPLLADTARDAAERPVVCDRYGVWGEKSMYGRAYMGVIRTTYLINGEGRVARRWDKVSVPGHAEEVLGAVHELLGLPKFEGVIEGAAGEGGAAVKKKLGGKKKVVKKGAVKKKKVAKKAGAGVKKKVAKKKAAGKKGAKKKGRGR